MKQSFQVEVNILHQLQELIIFRVGFGVLIIKRWSDKVRRKGNGDNRKELEEGVRAGMWRAVHPSTEVAGTERTGEHDGHMLAHSDTHIM